MPTFPLADEFFLINHDDLNGKPLLRRDLLGSGLVVALLAELIMQDRAALREGRVTVLDREAHGDDATDFVIDSLEMQRSAHSVRVWTDNLDDTAYELVARRLVARGVVRRVRPRRLLGTRKEHFPSVHRDAVQPLVSLNEVIENPGQADAQQALLVAMMAATGAERVLANEPDRDRINTAVARLVGRLPAELAQLLTGLEEAIAARLLSVRR